MTSGRATLAVVQTAPRSLELRELPLPDTGPEDGLLQVEACGICGSDYEQYEGALPVRFPLIPGHEPVGRIVELGDEAARRWDLKVGDRVAVETLIPCGFCRHCVGGAYRLCNGHRRMNAYGYLGLDVPPGLWGGYSQYLYLDPHALLHKIADSVPPEIAVLFNPLGAGFRWAVEMPGLAVGDTIVILGPGQRGLACVIAAREAGAGRIIVTGLDADEHKLALAKELGAHHAINVQRQDPVPAVREATDGRMADVVVDVTAYAVDAVNQAINLARRGGTVVLAGTKGPQAVPDFLSDRIVFKELTVKGAFGVDYPNYERAVRLIESGKYPLEKLHTHTLPLADAERALRLLAGREPGESAIHIALVP
ncbi:MAG: alcohol dehydrogenase catalytic domain-containing protein [Dehalococcoidia bacterium]|nr:alcohol dehydrogenase catalytic domain-containing protein [Dehalococcoidia bacterium]